MKNNTMEVKMGFIKENWTFLVCIIFAGIFIYGKYFVDVTEIAKLSSTFSVYFWLIFGILFIILKKIE